MRKINKAQARKLFNKDKAVMMIPHKANPESNWFRGTTFVKNKHNGDFDELVNQIERYNCNYQLGYYLAYYVVD